MIPEPISNPIPARILVIEDEVLIRVLVADVLRDAGFTVVEAADADAATSYLASGSQVDLIFSDVRMPGSINGLEFARDIRIHNPTLPIILTSANGVPGSIDGVGQFLPKPYRLDDVITLICDILRLPQPNTGL